MNIGKLYRVKKVTKSRNINVVIISESPNLLFNKTLDVLNNNDIFIPLEQSGKTSGLEVIKVCTPKGITGYAAFFRNEFSYEEVNNS